MELHDTPNDSQPETSTLSWGRTLRVDICFLEKIEHCPLAPWREADPFVGDLELVLVGAFEDPTLNPHRSRAAPGELE